MNEPEQTIMRTSLSRPQQLLGGDREMVIMAGLGAAMMTISRSPPRSCCGLLNDVRMMVCSGSFIAVSKNSGHK